MSGDTDDKVAIPHRGMFDLDCKLISGENLSNKIDIVAEDTNEFTIDYQKHNSLEHAICQRTIRAHGQCPALRAEQSHERGLAWWG